MPSTIASYAATFGAKPRIHKRGQPRGSGLGQRRWPVERSNAWVLENRRLALRYDRLGFIIQSLLQAACPQSATTSNKLGLRRPFSS